MRRSFTLCAAFAVALALLLVSGDNAHTVRGQTPASTPAAGSSGQTSADLENVRQEFTSFFGSLQQVVGQARQNTQARAAIDGSQGDPTAIFTQAQQAVANATPDQLAALQKVLEAQPSLLQLPAQLKSALPQLSSSAGASGATPAAAGQAAPKTDPARSSTNQGSLMGDCKSNLPSLVSAVSAGPPAREENNYDARPVFIATWGFQQGESALLAAYSVASALSGTILGTDKINAIAAGLATAAGVLNVFNLLAQQTFQAVLDCDTWAVNSWLYTQDSTGTYKQLALEADLKKLTAAAEVAGLTSGSCSAYQALPASFAVQLGDPSKETSSDANTAPGLLDDLKQMVSDSLTAMQGAGVNVNNAAALNAYGNEAYTNSQWQTACKYYAQAYVQLEK